MMLRWTSILMLSLVAFGCKTIDVPVPDANAAYWGQVKAYATMVEEPKTVANHLLAVAEMGAKAAQAQSELTRHWEKEYDKQYNTIANRIARLGWWTLGIAVGSVLVVNVVGGVAGGLGAGGLLGAIGKRILNGGGIFALGKWIGRSLNTGAVARREDTYESLMERIRKLEREI